MKIKTKIFLIFTILSFSLTAIGMLSLFYFSNNYLTDSIVSRLEIFTKTQASHLEGFLNQQIQKSIILAKDRHWEDLLNQGEGKGTPSGFTSEEFYNHSGVALADRVYKEYYQIFILDKKGEVILSTKKDSEGSNYSDREFFINSKQKTFLGKVFYDEGSLVYPIATPIISSDDSSYLGAVVVLIDMQRVSEIIGSNLGLGEKRRELFG